MKFIANARESMLTGDDAAKQAKGKQFYQAMQEETQAALLSVGLPPDYQTVPILNFRNIASVSRIWCIVIEEMMPLGKST